MKIYNSLTNTVQVIEPIKAGRLSIYSCGPTVYNNLHIGNILAFIYADLLRRIATISGFDVTHVMNITDVDDKTIRDSQKLDADTPLEKLKMLTDKYTEVFIQDVTAVGNDMKALQLVSAVDVMQEMILLVQELLDNQIAYITEDGIYFSIEEYIKKGHTYGILQHLDLSHLQPRINNDEYEKDSVSDFALWKIAKPGEPSWEATFTANGQTKDIPGRPGWHIECSAMSGKTLGVPFDIHTGGIDLKFPHHENEIAQSCGAGAPFLAKYFVHNNHVLVDGKKMSKSLGNFYTLRDIEAKGFRPAVFRLLVLQGHYRSESNFSWDSLEAAQNRLQRWLSNSDLQWQAVQEAADITSIIDTAIQSATTALQDDLDTPLALVAIENAMSAIESTGITLASHASLMRLIEFISTALGIDLSSHDLSNGERKLMNLREAARTSRNWDESDRLRDELTAIGIQVRDEASRTVWSRLR